MKKYNHIIRLALIAMLLVCMASQWGATVRAQQQDHTPQGDYETPEVPIWGTDPGDANGDGAIDVMDVILLRQHLAGWGVEVDSTGADANGDGEVDVRDVILLRQYLAGWNVTLGPQE